MTWELAFWALLAGVVGGLAFAHAEHWWRQRTLRRELLELEQRHAAQRSAFNAFATRYREDYTNWWHTPGYQAAMHDAMARLTRGELLTYDEALEQWRYAANREAS